MHAFTSSHTLQCSQDLPGHSERPAGTGPIHLALSEWDQDTGLEKQHKSSPGVPWGKVNVEPRMPAGEWPGPLLRPAAPPMASKALLRAQLSEPGQGTQRAVPSHAQCQLCPFNRGQSSDWGEKNDNYAGAYKREAGPSRGRQTDNGVTGLPASSGCIHSGRIESPEQLRTPAPASAVPGRPERICALPSGSPAHGRVLGAGAGGGSVVCRKPPGHSDTTPMSGESLLVFEALS